MVRLILQARYTYVCLNHFQCPLYQLHVSRLETTYIYINLFFPSKIHVLGTNEWAIFMNFNYSNGRNELVAYVHLIIFHVILRVQRTQ